LSFKEKHKMIIPFSKLLEKYQIRSTGIIHVGAHRLEERNDYFKEGINKILWVEGNPNLTDQILSIIKSRPNPLCQEYLASCLVDVKAGKTQKFYLSDNTQTSSILEGGLGFVEIPENRHNQAIEIMTQRLDSIIKNMGLDDVAFDFLNIDVQGVELRVMRSLGMQLYKIQWIYTEFNVGETYKGCDKLWMMDFFLVFRGFRRRELKFATRNWGDAFYERVNPGGIIQGLIPTGKCMIQNIYYIIGNLIRPLAGMK
jgi:FkbM family methyltransferase